VVLTKKADEVIKAELLKTARDPNSRINKSLRKWDCNTGCKVNYVSGAVGGYRPQND